MVDQRARRKVKLLTRLRIDEVSSVDRGAGDGVKVLLMKRATPNHRDRFAEFFRGVDFSKVTSTPAREAEPMSSSIEYVREVAKHYGVAALAKHMVNTSRAYGLSEHE